MVNKTYVICRDYEDYRLYKDKNPHEHTILIDPSRTRYLAGISKGNHKVAIHRLTKDKLLDMIYIGGFTDEDIEWFG